MGREKRELLLLVSRENLDLCYSGHSISFRYIFLIEFIESSEKENSKISEWEIFQINPNLYKKKEIKKNYYLLELELELELQFFKENCCIIEYLPEQSKFIYTCKFTVAGRRVQHVLRLSDRLKVRQGRRHHLPVAERQVHHLIIRDVADRDGENSLGGYSCPDEKNEKNERNVNPWMSKHHETTTPRV